MQRKLTIVAWKIIPEKYLENALSVDVFDVASSREEPRDDEEFEWPLFQSTRKLNCARIGCGECVLSADSRGRDCDPL